MAHVLFLLLLYLKLYLEVVPVLSLFFGCTAQDSRSYFPSQGSNLCPLHWEQSLNCWTTREVPIQFYLLLVYEQI